MAGKGSRFRPVADREEFAKNWDAIFGPKDKPPYWVCDFPDGVQGVYKTRDDCIRVGGTNIKPGPVSVISAYAIIGDKVEVRQFDVAKSTPSDSCPCKSEPDRERPDGRHLRESLDCTSGGDGVGITPLLQAGTCIDTGGDGRDPLAGA